MKGSKKIEQQSKVLTQKYKEQEEYISDAESDAESEDIEESENTWLRTLDAYKETNREVQQAISEIKKDPEASKKISEKVKAKLAKIILNQDGQVKPFSEIQVSTRTVIVVTNCIINLEALFNYIPITDFQPIVKRRGRKKRINIEPTNPKLPYGSIINAQHELKVRGTLLKPKKEKEEGLVNKAYFLHCVTLYVSIEDPESGVENKFKNVKIYSNGKFKITGCKNDKQYIDTVKAIFKVFSQIEEFTGESVVQCQEPYFRAVYNTVMQNMDFYMGFSIYREYLDQFINHNTTYKSIYEGSVNTGVNIKIPINPKDDSKLMCMDYDRVTHQLEQKIVNWADYKSSFVKKSNNKPQEHTFLVFASGHVIFTSAGPDMEKVFQELIQILIQNRVDFEEK